jgi:pyrroloquinoline quinone biosynthesis protein B
VIRDTASGATAVYAPGLGAIEPPLWGALQAAACVLVDGTFWSDEEMISQGLSAKRARDMGHLPQSGRGGMLEWLAKLKPRTRRILIHVNNTNPILDEDSPQRAELARAGIEVAVDGLEITL